MLSLSGTEVSFSQRRPRFTVKNGVTMFLERGKKKPVILPAIPVFILDDHAPRPDKVDADYDNLFQTVSGADSSRPGLYITVRNGHVALIQGGKILNLGRDEAAFAGENVLQRFEIAPDFMIHDPYPRPEEFDVSVQRILELISDESGKLECRI